MDIARLRLTNQHLSGPKFHSADEVVRFLGAVQAQDYAQALWGIGLRMEQATVADVERATRDRTVIRSWGMRNTLHFIMAEDAKWMLDLFSARILAKLTPKVWAYHAVEPAMVATAEKVFLRALRGGNVIRRSGMVELLNNAGIPDDHQQAYFLFSYLSQVGLLCLGPNEGREQTFALLDEWAPDQRRLTRDEALADLARRFFASHAPATVADFGNWAGLSMPEARTALDLVKDDLVAETVGTTEYWLPPDSKPGSGTFLLPAYDEFLIGYKNRDPSFQKYGAVSIATANGMFFPTIVVDGQVAGLWKRTILKTRVNVAVQPIAAVPDAKIKREADRLGRFLSLPAALK